MEQGDNSEGNGGRISSLPDCLLHLIMSLLTTRQAIQLCVLSKRWKNLWTTLPVLFFNFLDFHNTGVVVSRAAKNDEIEKFTQFVSTFLLLRNGTSGIHTFRLCCPRVIHDPFGSMFGTIQPWIYYVVQHNIRVIEIACDAEWAISSFPPCLYTCRSLEDLSLSVSEYQHPPNTVNLPRLRRLHLGYMYISQNFMDKLLGGCPMLEDLYLKFLHGQSNISSQSLKHLQIENCCTEEMATFKLINMPNLQSFCYAGCLQPLKGNMWNMPSVNHVSFDLHICCKVSSVDSNFLCGLTNAQFLDLRGSSIQGLLPLPKSLVFHNLKSLSMIDFCVGSDFDILASFSERMPNLRKLSLDLSYCCVMRREYCLERTISPLQCKQLQQIEFKSSSCDEDDELDDFLKNLLDDINIGDVQVIMTPKP